MNESARVLVALVLALVLGAAVAASGNATLLNAANLVAPIGTLWVNAIRMTIIPLIVSLLVTGVASASDIKAIGRIGRKTLLIFVMLSGAVAIVMIPLAAALFRIPTPSQSPASTGVAPVIAVVFCAVALFGPLTMPSQSVQLLATKSTADYIRSNDVAFVSGYFWSVWPIELQALEDGRTATYVTAGKSGGDPANYRAALDRELAKGDGPPKAVCVGEELSVCITYLEYWTRPGWHEVPGECPIPISNPLNGSPPVQACRLLEFTPQQ